MSCRCRKNAVCAEHLGLLPDPLPRNPWTGINPWREFIYDVRNPAQFCRRVWAGVMGRNPEVSSAERWVGLGCIVLGHLMMLFGLAVVIADVRS